MQFILNTSSSDLLPPYSDKVILPQHVLSSIINEIPENKLPHPLIFKIINSQDSSIYTYIGVKQFTSEEDQIILPKYIFTKLSNPETIVIELQQHIPKSNSLKLKPKQFYANINNWKFFLENKLNQFYTLLIKGDDLILEIDGLRYELEVEEINNDPKIKVASIIDTDVVLEIIPINDEQAKTQLEYINNEQIIEEIKIGEELDIINLKSILNGGFIPTINKVDITKLDYLKIELKGDADFIVGMDKFLAIDSFTYSTMDKEEKIVELDLKQDIFKNKLLKYKDITEINGDTDNDEKYIYIVAFTWDQEENVSINITDQIVKETSSDLPNVPTTQCSNCLKFIPSDKLILHENFCKRNNIRCPNCNSIFHKTIPATHWHCDKCDAFGDTQISQFKHYKLYHSQQQYICCTTQFNTFFELSHHKSTNCPHKLHQCRFCHLIVPQELSTYQDKFENLSHHENICGNKTIECFKCTKIIRVKDFPKHLKLHEINKIQFNNDIHFNKCSNLNCIQELSSSNELGLCDICYGPLYINQHDPQNLKLQLRIERKYMIQLNNGCNNSWCNNEYCKTGNPKLQQNSMKDNLFLLNDKLFKNIYKPSLPINSKFSNHIGSESKNKLWFCVNESISNKKLIFDIINSENEYDESLIYKSINLNSDEFKIRSWLDNNGIKRI
ncbi:uncharacterized protein KGF55_005147 [Candida pseudojiufengensis]|uniref:uncharacterized protein n=1 Tax=Candida pseudojiufengensis TaxID=497109 RepID=UPI002224B4CF|nr:uncharacterized protein KGF55_005147 [Candida pseudojiufengensis]KAI5959915.1 hypothetical protein KGF55_005147 [Candida pseudojiufengensis]